MDVHFHLPKSAFSDDDISPKRAKLSSTEISSTIDERNSLKPHIFGVQGRSRSSMLVPRKSLSAVLVMIRNKSVSICNKSRARLVDSSRNRTFSRRYPNLMHSYGGLLQPRGQSLHCLNLRLMPNISCPGCPGLS